VTLYAELRAIRSSALIAFQLDISASDCAQLSEEVVGVRLNPLLDEAAVIRVAEDVDQLPLHVLAVRLNGADGV
jgi:hypothetical protein